jgi:hypothetical protein
MIAKLLRDSAMRFIQAENAVVAYWSNFQRSRGSCCPVNKIEFEKMIKAELEVIKADKKIAV